MPSPVPAPTNTTPGDEKWKSWFLSSRKNVDMTYSANMKFGSHVNHFSPKEKSEWLKVRNIDPFEDICNSLRKPTKI